MATGPRPLRLEGRLASGRCGEAPLGGAAVSVVDGRISALGPADQVPRQAGEEVVTAPAAGLIAPGLVDLLCYGGGGAQVADAEPEAIATLARTHAARGTTSLLVGLESCEPSLARRRLRAVSRAIEAGLAPAVAGVHLEGPFLAAPRRGIHPASALRAPEIALLDELLEAGGGHVRLVTLAGERPGALELITRLTALGVAVSQGHSEATWAEAEAAARAGARLCTHLFNAMAPLGHREPGLAGLWLVPPPPLADLCATLIVDGAHVAAPMVQLAARLLGPARLALISDAMAPAGLAGSEGRTWTFGGRAAAVSGGALRAVDDGTLVGSVLTLGEAVANLRRLTGWPLHDCALAASGVPARAAGLTGRGQLAAGARADLVILDADGTVLRTWHEGCDLKS